MVLTRPPRDRDGGHLAWPLGMRLAERISAFDNIYPKHAGLDVNDRTEQRDQHDRCGFC